jgi:hypothetical protein
MFVWRLRGNILCAEHLARRCVPEMFGIGGSKATPYKESVLIIMYFEALRGERRHIEASLRVFSLRATDHVLRRRQTRVSSTFAKDLI